MSRLERTIEFLTENRTIHISVHDVVGILGNADELKLQWKYQINECPFCAMAKSSSNGHEMCMKLKAMSVAKCKRVRKPYIGRCYLGIRQAVYPVIWRNNLMCIVYVSNMMNEEDAQQCMTKYKTMVRRAGISPQSLAKAAATTESVQSFDKYMDAAHIVNDVIINILSESGSSRVDSKNHIISNVLNYCNESYSTDLKLPLLAKIYFIHPDYLCKLFKKEVGVSFSDYLNNVRIEKARRLIAETDKKIIDIAFEVGYKSDTYFIRKFKQLMGITPKQYQLVYAKRKWQQAQS